MNQNILNANYNLQNNANVEPLQSGDQLCVINSQNIVLTSCKKCSMELFYQKHHAHCSFGNVPNNLYLISNTRQYTTIC